MEEMKNNNNNNNNNDNDNSNNHYESFYSENSLHETDNKLKGEIKGQLQKEVITENLKNGIFENNIYTSISEIEDADEEYLIFIVHGAGQNEQKLENTMQKIAPIIKSLYLTKKNLLFKQIHIRIINWKSKISSQYTGPLNKISFLNDQTRGWKNIIHQMPLDILFYTNSKCRYEILNDIIEQMNEYYKLVSKHRKLFKGMVSLIGHSIGTVMLYDILTNMKYEKPIVVVNDKNKNKVKSKMDEITELILDEENLKENEKVKEEKEENGDNGDKVKEVNNEGKDTVKANDTDKGKDEADKGRDSDKVVKEANLIQSENEKVLDSSSNKVKVHPKPDNNIDINKNNNENNEEINNKKKDTDNKKKNTNNTKKDTENPHEYIKDINKNIRCATEENQLESNLLNNSFINPKQVDNYLKTTVSNKELKLKRISKKNIIKFDVEMEVCLTEQDSEAFDPEFEKYDNGLCDISNGGNKKKKIEPTQILKIVSKDDKIKPLLFPVCHFFMTGSPLALFLTIEKGSNATIRPEDIEIVKDFHNIMHPMDPIAYRIEPLIRNFPIEDAKKSYTISHWENDGIRKPFWGKVLKLLCYTSLNDDQDVDNLLNLDGIKRYDFILQESPSEKAIKLAGILFSHQSYWNNPDVFYFILKMIHWKGYNSPIKKRKDL